MAIVQASISSSLDPFICSITLHGIFQPALSHLLYVWGKYIAPLIRSNVLFDEDGPRIRGVSWLCGAEHCLGERTIGTTSRICGGIALKIYSFIPTMH